LTITRPSPTGPDELAGLLAQELQALRSFVALLSREQSLLTEGDTEPLTSLAAEKSHTAMELSRLAAARDRELGHLQLPPGRAGMDAWVQSATGSASRTDWSQLLELAVDARTLNESNGKLIALRLQHNQQALNILMAAADQAVTYGPDGQQRSGGSGRSLGSA
jgi:flagellar biosynthesis protein FlgN